MFAESFFRTSGLSSHHDAQVRIQDEFCQRLVPQDNFNLRLKAHCPTDWRYRQGLTHDDAQSPDSYNTPSNFHSRLERTISNHASDL